MFVTVLLICIITFTLFQALKTRRFRNFPPGPLPVPFVGNILQLNLRNPLKDMKKLSETYGNVYSVFIGSTPVVILHGLQAVKEALVTQAVEFAGRPQGLLVNDVTEYKGVIIVNYGTHWKEQRRFALSTLRNFGLGKKSMEARIQEEVAHLTESLEKYKGQIMSPHTLLHNAVSNVICSVLLGQRFSYNDISFQEMIHCVSENLRLINGPWGMLYDALPIIRPLPLPYRKAITNAFKVKSFLKSIVEEHKKTRIRGEVRDIIDSYLEEMEKRKNEQSSFDNENLTILLTDLFAAGTDTTSSTLRFAILYLMIHPDIQAKCHQEIDTVLGQNKDFNFEDRLNMPYMQATIHEIQRFADVVPLGVFHATTKETHLYGYKLPKNTTVIANLSSVLHDETQWKFPHEFNPSNFLNSQGEFIKPEAFMPFSAGPRLCLGEALAKMEIFFFMVGLLRRFQFIWPQGCGEPDPTPMFGITQESTKYKMIFKVRENIN
ncbi:cytochrome P450 2D3 [Erpetoichthys calabaricus]|uniref:cytochrome P450 2D3 n=1 Tax=Erpetoichthys calabaricus TaxID=27687 RepID=UPI0022347F0D|nr:cytochrome P450 2D3 [Erpetoichthys calabaricus]